MLRGVADGRDVQLLLAAEVVVNGGQVDAGAVGDLADGGGLEALLGEERAGRFQDPGAGHVFHTGAGSDGRFKRSFYSIVSNARLKSI